MNPDKLAKSETTDGQPPRPGFEDRGAPAPIGPDGQHEAYWVLSVEERAKGFVRPVRRSYKHVGVQPTNPVRDLTPEEHAQYDKIGYVAYEQYPPREDSVVGRFWTKADLEGGCGTVTKMGQAIAETYARDPKYYGSTFCVACGKHFPVSQFVWLDAPTERVGT